MNSSKLNLALRRFAKVLAAGALAATVAFIAGPDLADAIGTQDAVLLAAVLTPILSALEKALVPFTS